MYIFVKIVLTAIIVAAISELARRYSLIAATLASLPLTSILAMIWLYYDTRDAEKIAVLSRDIMWLVAPSLVFFLVLPWLLHRGLSFYLAMAASCGIMAVTYAGFLFVRRMIF